MEQIKEKKLNLFDVLFGRNEYETYDVSDTTYTYVESSYIKSLKKEAEGAINKEKEKNKSSKNGGGFNNIKTETLEKMRKKLEKTSDTLEDKEIEDR